MMPVTNIHAKYEIFIQKQKRTKKENVNGVSDASEQDEITLFITPESTGDHLRAQHSSVVHPNMSTFRI